MRGYPIGWASPKDMAFKFHAWFINYHNLEFSGINVNDAKTDLNGVIATGESAGIVAYLSWLLRVKALLA